MRTWIGLVLALALALPAAAQAAGPEAVARLDAGVVKLGDRTWLQVEVEGADSARLLDLPAVAGLEIGPAGRPSRKESFSFVRGRTTSYVRLTWSVPVRPLRVGTYEIPSVTVEAAGRTLTTEAVRLTVVEDLRGEELGFLEVDLSSDALVEGQPFTLDIRFGWDASLVSKINHAELSLPWYGRLPGLVEMEGDTNWLSGRKVQIPLNQSGYVDVMQVDPVERGGRRYVCFEMRRSYLASRSGELAFSASTLEFSQVLGSGGLFGAPPRKAESYFVVRPAFTVEVTPLPEAGRPLDYTGAVGSIDVRADAEPRDVDAGDSIKLTVRWTGRGNFEFFELPDPSRMRAFDGFRVYGSSTQDKGLDYRTAVYDLAPLGAQVEEIPPLPLHVYDPERRAYTTVETRPIPIRVRALERETVLEAEGEEPRAGRDVADIDARPLSGQDAGADGPSLATLVGTLAGVLAGWLGLRTFVRRRGDPDAPLERRRRAARRRLARRLAAARDAAEELDAVLAFLAARTREPEQAWVGRELADWARAQRKGDAAVAPDDARALDELVAALEREVFARRNGDGGRARSDRIGSDRILAVADRLIRGGL